jgi:hypothetical protein
MYFARQFFHDEGRQDIPVAMDHWILYRSILCERFKLAGVLKNNVHLLCSSLEINCVFLNFEINSVF